MQVREGAVGREGRYVIMSNKVAGGRLTEKVTFQQTSEGSEE